MAQAKPTLDPVSEQLCKRVRELRRKRGWTLQQMSDVCDVSRSMLSQIERRGANPTLAVACRIAMALGLDLGELVESPGSSHTIDVVRADDPSHLFRHDNDCRIRTLSPLHLEKDVEFYELVLPPMGKLTSAAHYEGTRECLTVQKGAVRIRSGGQDCLLKKGDSAHYRADLPHAIENTGRSEAKCFLLVTYQKQ